MPRPKLQFGPCTVEGCNREKRSLGLCQKHYMMQRLHGRTEKVNTGEKRSHPLYSTWFERKQRGSLCEAWHDNFWAFVQGVGERPSPKHLLKKPDLKLPYGPDNFVWADILWRRPEETQKEFTARKWKSRVEKHPDFERRRHLIRNFGLSPEQYDAMLSFQNGVCMICKNPEIAKQKKTGRVKSLAVDHCHTGKHVRDLLCWRCNVTLGKVKDSIPLLLEMVAYLQKWQAPNHPGLSRPPPQFANQHDIMLDTPWGRLCASDAARKAGLLPGTVLSRLRNGWPHDQVLQPLKRPRRKPRDPGDII